MAVNGSNFPGKSTPQAAKVYEFGPFRLDSGQRILTCDGRAVRMKPKTFELLEFLVERSNQVVDKNELMNEVWRDAFVEEANLSVHVSHLRKILSEDRSNAVSIETFPKVGYRLVLRPTANRDIREKNLQEKQEILNEAVESVEPNRPVAISSGPIQISDIDRFSDVRNDNSVKPNARHRPRYVMFAVIAMIAGSLVVAGLLYFRDRDGVDAYEEMAVSRFTNLGMATWPAVSPGGNYIAYGREENSSFTIWLKVIGSPSEIQVLPPTEGVFWGVTFMPDGKSLVYGARLKNQPLASYVMPLFGGSATKLPLNRTGRVAFSPDGTQLAYLDINLPEGKTHVVVANADGSDVRQITTRQAPDYYWISLYPSWSPDGKRIACIAQQATESTPRVVEVDVETGVEKPITKQVWTSMRGVAWLPSGDGLLITASEETSSIIQIWHISYPDGKATRITHDTDNYSGMSISTDGRTFATTVRRRPTSLWVAPVNSVGADHTSLSVDIAHAVQISANTTDGADTTEGYGGMTWTPDGRIVFTSEEAGNGDIWSMNADGSDRRQLTTDPRWDTGPAISPDGQTIAFMSRRSATESLWLMDIDGGNQRRITSKLIERLPAFSSDGRFLYFASWETGKASIWRMPTNDGEAKQVTTDIAFRPDISPDDNMLLYGTPNGFAVLDPETSKPIRAFSYAGGLPQWSPIPNAFSFVRSGNDFVGNIWLQSLGSDAPRQLTDFRSNGISSYAWSFDGTKLAYTRGTTTSDVVLMTTVR